MRVEFEIMNSFFHVFVYNDNELGGVSTSMPLSTSFSFRLISALNTGMKLKSNVTSTVRADTTKLTARVATTCRSQLQGEARAHYHDVWL